MNHDYGLSTGYFLFQQFLKYNSKNIVSESDVKRVLQMAAQLKLEELSSDTAEALINFLKQVEYIPMYSLINWLLQNLYGHF